MATRQELREIMHALKIFANKRTTWLLCVGALVAVLLFGNSDLLLGKATPIWDANFFYGPLFSLVSDHVRSGHLLLWNPWMNGGSPDLADPQVGSSSPVLLVFALFFPNVLHGFVTYWIALWIFGGIGMLVLCRYLQLPAWGGLIAALGYVASGFYIGHGEHTTILYSFSYLPWILWRFDLALVRRSYWNMVVAGTLWGLSALGGYPALVILNPLFLCLWGVGRSALGFREAVPETGKTTKSRLIFTLVGMCVFGVVGVVIMSPAYLGFLMYARGYTSRASGLSLEAAMQGPLPPDALSTFASPFLYLLNKPPYSIWPESDISASSVYCGALVVSLAAIALLKCSKWRFWLATIVGCFLAAAVGSHLPVYRWLYALVPPIRYFRGPSLFSAYAIFALCILAAYGSQDIDSSRITNDISSRKGFAIVPGIASVIAFVSFVATLSTAHLTLHEVALPAGIFLVVWLSVVVVFLLWWRKGITNRLLVFLLVIISVFDATSAIKIGKPTLYSGASTDWWNFMASNHVRELDLRVSGLDRQLFPPDEVGQFQNDCNLPLKIPTFANNSGMVNPFFEPYVLDPVLYRLVVGKQRMWFSPNPVWLPPSEQSFAEYVKVSHRLGAPPLILHAADDMLKGSASSTYRVGQENANWSQSAQAVAPATIELLRYTPNELSFRYEAPADGWLLVTDRYARFWNAAVNDRPTDIAGANFIFRGIPVSRGVNTVRFHYEPTGYLGLVFLSWGTLVVVLAWGTASCFVGRRLKTKTVLTRADLQLT